MADEKRQSPHRPARVVLVDDHPIVRKALAGVVNNDADMTVCGEADTIEAALSVIQSTTPDVAIVDLSLKGGDGLELIKDIAAQFPKLAVLVLSMREESIYAERALRAGARGYVSKEQPVSEVVEAIRKVLAGEIYLNSEMSTKLLRAMLKWPRQRPRVEQLSDRELKVLGLIGTGLSTAQIAEQLHLSVKTIETYRERIKEKLDLSDASELLKYAIEWTHDHGVP